MLRSFCMNAFGIYLFIRYATLQLKYAHYDSISIDKKARTYATHVWPNAVVWQQHK